MNDIAKKLFSADKNNQREEKLNNFSEYVIKNRKFSAL
jgi:hypothetical protein